MTNPLVQRYSVLYTTQLTQKLKKWHDGTIRFHHYNSCAILYSPTYIQLGKTFISSASTSAGLCEDQEIEFKEDGYLVQVQDLEWEGETDIKELRKDIKQQRERASKLAREWARSETNSLNNNNEDKDNKQELEQGKSYFKPLTTTFGPIRNKSSSSYHPYQSIKSDMDQPDSFKSPKLGSRIKNWAEGEKRGPSSPFKPPRFINPQN